ncbi:MAG: hypothetical protein ABJD07_15870 [Gemmatimonadaceae bacterium]
MTEYQMPLAPPVTAAEYQAVTLKLTRRPHDDDDALTDMLNERSRAGWAPSMMSQGEGRLTVIFRRTAPTG